jgi:hypothetical protein
MMAALHVGGQNIAHPFGETGLYLVHAWRPFANR